MQLATLGKARTMSSREIAELVGSAHDSVLKTVRRFIEEGVVSGNETPYIHPQNRQTYYEIHLSFRDTLIVASGYSVEMRAKIIDRWQELEAAQTPKLPQTYAQALRLAAEQAEQIEAQQLQIEAQKPAVEFLDRYVQAKSAKGIREVAKVLGIKERHFTEMLEVNGVMFRQGGNLLPMAQYQHSGYFEVKTGESNGHAYLQTRFTPEGVAWIAKKIAKMAANLTPESRNKNKS